MELYAGYGKNIVTALATINGSAVGILATEKPPCATSAPPRLPALFVCAMPTASLVVTVVNTEGFG